MAIVHVQTLRKEFFFLILNIKRLSAKYKKKSARKSKLRK